jgi:cbb3-type cytochrome oxidase subunit 3
MNALVVIKNIVVLALSLFFLVFGVDILIRSFKMANPLEFVMTLFSASFIILFSIASLLYVYFRFFPNKSNNEMDHADTK